MTAERKKIYVLCACIMPLMICSGLVYSMFSLYLFEVVKLSKTQIGLLFMVGSAVGLFAGPALGRLSDRYGRKPVILACLVSFVVIFIGYALGRSYAILFPIQILEGTTWVAIGAASTAYIADSIGPANRGWAMGAINRWPASAGSSAPVSAGSCPIPWVLRSPSWQARCWWPSVWCWRPFLSRSRSARIPASRRRRLNRTI